MAKIYGNIATINNNHTIKVSIYNKNLSAPDINIDASHTVKFSAEPVEITQQQDNTFEHILKTQCKIRLVTKEWLGDYLFAANYSSIVVNVWVDNHCVFCGYVTPHTYNQSYAHQWEEVEINCVDILSTLKDRRLTDNTTYEELVAQSTTRPFSWFLDQMDLDTLTVVIPNYPDIDYQEAEMMWTEIDWSRIVTQEGDITYYGIEAEVVRLDEDTAMNTGNTRQGEQKTPTWIESTDTCIVDGVSYYKEYAHITVAGNDVNTGDWRVGSNAGGMPVVVRTENRVDGWTTGVLPQPFDFYEHYTTYNIYDNGMEIAGSDGIGEQIPLYPSTTTAGNYYEFRQGSADDVDVDEDTGYIYYKDYAWVCVNGTCENSGQWQRGNEKAHPTGTHTAITGWQYDNPPVPFEYYETISHYTDYSDGTSVYTHATMGHQIPLTPNTTTNGSYYEFRQGDTDDLDYDSSTDKYYYKNYAWVVVNGVAEKTNNWSRGDNYKINEYFTIESLTNGDVTVTLPQGLSTSDLSSLSYSKDKTNWTTWTNDEQGTTITVPMSTGDKLYLKGLGQKHMSSVNYNYVHTNISSTCDANIYGNIMSLLYGDNFINNNTIYEHSFYSIFSEWDNLISAEYLVLPATTLANNCYEGMFSFCSSLTTPPELPATTLGEYCYQVMFWYCTSLTTAPELPATTLTTGCYAQMFHGCSSLTTPPELPATTLTEHCYTSMFRECTSLTSAPELPATVIPDEGYFALFYGCTSLTTAPELPATTLGHQAYWGMFYGCQITTAPELPATTLGDWCYVGMFYGCQITTAPELPATTLAPGCYIQMFDSCTSLTTAPELPATTLAHDCYEGMFRNCTSLTTAPVLPATTLTEECYKQMFDRCSSLSSITMLATDISATNCLTNWVEGVNASGTFIKAASMNSLPTGISGIPSGWTVINYAKIYGKAISTQTTAPTITLNGTTYTADIWDNTTKVFGFDNIPTNITSIGQLSNIFETLVFSELLDTSNVTSLYRMFYNCSELTSLDISHFNTSNVTNMESVFSRCNILTSLDISHFNTSNVTNISYMFQACKGLTSIDLSNFITDNVSQMLALFNGCTGLTSIDLSNWEVKTSTSTSNMFYRTTALTSIIMNNVSDDTFNKIGSISHIHVSRVTIYRDGDAYKWNSSTSQWELQS